MMLTGSTPEGRIAYAAMFRDAVKHVIGREIRELSPAEIEGEVWKREPGFFSQEEIAKLDANLPLERQKEMFAYAELLGMMERPTSGLDEQQVIAMGGGYGTYEDLFPPGSEPPAEPLDPRPMVEQSIREHEVIAEVIPELGKHQDVYQRGGQLVEVTEDSVAENKRIQLVFSTPRIRPIPRPRLRSLISECVRLFEVKGEGEDATEKDVRPADWLVNGISDAGSYPRVRHLEAIVETPILREDGSILQTPGYDDASGILYRPSAPFPDLPENPSKDDALRAVASIHELVKQFPFASKVHRASWLAALLTPLARFAFRGPSPLFLIDANIRGIGKGLLCEVISQIALGRKFAIATYARNDEEMGKVVQSIAKSGERTFLLDNVTGLLGSATLDAALTADEWQGRDLMTNDAPRRPLLVTWYATGNNVSVGADTCRRVCHIRLETTNENPENREGFKFPRLAAHVAANRVEYLSAALTILRAYWVAGRPDQGLKPWGSFEGWSDVVRSCVNWLTGFDPGATRQELAEQADTSASLLRSMLHGWLELDGGRTGVPTTEAFRQLKEYPNRFHALREAVAELPSSRGKEAGSRDASYWLRSHRDRFMDGLCFSEWKDRNKTSHWKVVTAGDAGDEGDVFLHTRSESEPTHSPTGPRACAHPGADTRETSPASPASPAPTGACPKCGGCAEMVAAAAGVQLWECKCGHYWKGEW